MMQHPFIWLFAILIGMGFGAMLLLAHHFIKTMRGET